ncbi:hypothetical protein ACWCQN_13065 [Streptomyces sp. NPDC001984]
MGDESTTAQTEPVMEQPLVRLHKASLVLQLLAAHPELASAPINWEINDRDDLWANVSYGHEGSEAAAQLLAGVLGVKVISDPVKGRFLYAVYGTFAGTEVSLQAFGPKVADAAPVMA